MPGLEAHPLQVVPCVAEVDVVEIPKLPVDFRGSEALREVGNSEADLPHVKIADAVEGKAGWGE